MTTAPAKFRYISRDRRVLEDRRFVVGKGNFVADIVRPNMKHVALVFSPHPAARIVKIDAGEASRIPGVQYVLGGEEIAAATQPMPNGMPTPEVKRYPLAVGQARYVGEWVAAVVADTRALAEDAAEKVRVEYELLPFVVDGKDAFRSGAPAVHPAHGSNVLLDKTFVWGDVEADFAASPRKLSFSQKWGRSSTVPIETFGVIAEWDPWREVLDVWASIQMPKYADQIAGSLRLPMNAVRVHQDVDVGGSYGVKRGIKQTVLVAYLSKKLNVPVRLIEDRLDNMRGGDAHGPERNFDVEIAFDDNGIIRSMKMEALDNVGAYAGRSPFQLGKPIGAIVGPYKIKSVQYRAIAVTSNKTVQEAVRAFGQSPTNYTIERALDEVAWTLNLDRLEVRRRNFIQPHEFPYLIPSGTTYDSGNYPGLVDKVVKQADLDALYKERDRLRSEGLLAGIGVASCLEPSGGNSAFEPLLNRQNKTTTWMDSCRIAVDALGTITATMHTTSSGQGHETLVATVVGEALEVDPEKIRISRAHTLDVMPSNSPVGSRMAIMLGGAAFHAANKLKHKMMRIAAHDLGVSLDDVVWNEGTVSNKNNSAQKLSWNEIVLIAHRHYYRMPDDMEPGLTAQHVMQVPNGGKLPTDDDRIQMYPCFSFEFHVVLMSIDPDIGKPEFRRYVIGHDCGTVINPKIVHGMTMGGIAHGIGAALLEEFAYDEQGQLLTQSFMDYLLPSAHEVPKIETVHQVTPSPLTVFGQKGSGESGYLGAPAAISGAINDALRPLGIKMNSLPLKITKLGDAIAEARAKAGKEAKQ